MKVRQQVLGVLAGAALLMGSSAHAALIHFTGDIQNNTDVVFVNFSLASDATDVRVWTDSFMSGINFDPITALWNGDTGALLAQNDDDPFINPATQTYWDSGFFLNTLSAGNYVFSVAAYNNFVEPDSTLSDAQFRFADLDPIPLSQWCQPANHCNMGTYWSVWLDGVDEASVEPPTSVPEPATLGLLGLGLGLIGARRFAGRRAIKVA